MKFFAFFLLVLGALASLVTGEVGNKMHRWVGKVAVVTGASAGIGAAICEALVKEGVTVVGLARRVHKIHELAERLKEHTGKLHGLECDLEIENEIASAFDRVEKDFGGVDILVNNAGIMKMESVIGGSTDSFRKILNINVLAYAICSSHAIQSMKRRASLGHVININSFVGHNAEVVTIPIGLYGASKYAVTALSVELQHEIEALKLRVKVTSISPGAVNTDLIKNSGLDEAILKELKSLNTEDVANAVIFALATPPNVLISEVILQPTGFTE